MRPKRAIWFLTILVILALFLMIGGVDVMARGGGGGGGAGGGGAGGGGGGAGGGGGPGGIGGHSVGVRGGPPGAYRMQRVYDGPAGGGAFSSRPAPQPPQATPRFQSHTRPETGTKVGTDNQTRPSPQRPAVSSPAAQPTGQEVRAKQKQPGEYGKENYWDHWHHRRHRVALGTVYTESEFRDLRCQNPTVVDGVNYYNCGGAWHRRAYSGGSVVYMVVEGPGS